MFRTTFHRVKKSSFIVVGVSGALIAAAAVAPVSGAWFFDARTGTGHVSSGTLNLSVTGQDTNSGSLNFEADALAPGTSSTETYTVTNTGTVAGTAQFQMDQTVTNGGSADVSQVSYTVSDDQTSATLGSTGGSVDLGTLQGGESRTFTLSATLDSHAGNEWQGINASNNIAVTLTQVH